MDKFTFRDYLDLASDLIPMVVILAMGIGFIVMANIAILDAVK